MPGKILFISNPNSGTSNRGIDRKLIEKYYEREKWEVELVETQYAGNAREIATKAKNMVDVVVAIGGDGTVNEVATSIINSNTAFGIIPRGSGNGLSRFLGFRNRPGPVRCGCA